MTEFLLGGAGALAPEILRLYKWRFGLNRYSFPPSYFAISVLYAALGGLLAAVLGDTGHPVQALYIGAALPFILDAGVRGVTRSNDDSGGPRSGIEEIHVVRRGPRDKLFAFAAAL